MLRSSGCTTGGWGWELESPASTEDLRCYNGHNEECHNSGLASESDRWAVEMGPFGLEVDDAEATCTTSN